ncbi:MAG: hypothetical protein KW806_00245 [Candidatus Yanofskybacteria bacterium]|nr:hypothetical protein [Candidatus Yanofskybacteria bacterium]
MKYFNEQAFQKNLTLAVAPSGFRYGFIADVFRPEIYERLIAEFPDVKKFKLVDKISGGGHKRFYIGPLYDVNKHMGCMCHLSSYSSLWQEVLQESASSEFISFLSSVLGVPCNSLATFGHTYGNEGCEQEVHIDGAVREDHGEHPSTLATLLYFNDKSDNIGGTCVYAPDRSTILFQAPSMRNGMFFFEQHPEAWHGFPKMPAGAERRLVSLAYSQELESIPLKTSLAHQLTCVNKARVIIKRALGI